MSFTETTPKFSPDFLKQIFPQKFDRIVLSGEVAATLEEAHQKANRAYKPVLRVRDLFYELLLNFEIAQALTQKGVNIEALKLQVSEDSLNSESGNHHAKRTMVFAAWDGRPVYSIPSKKLGRIINRAYKTSSKLGQRMDNFAVLNEFVSHGDNIAFRYLEQSISGGLKPGNSHAFGPNPSLEKLAVAA